MSSVSEAVQRVFAVLDQMELPYLVGGSVASSIHGVSRPTMDVDLVVDIEPHQVEEFSGLLKPDFYADPDMIREALGRGRAFNLIHYATTFKVDIFPLRADAYSAASFARRRYEESHSFGPTPIECTVASPEDTILRKLEWYRAGGETSERQWNDLRGVVRVNGAKLDTAYLREWAPQLNVSDLVERLLNEPTKS
jgi:hypothetical protein